MIAKLIRWSLANRFLVLLITGLLVAAGVYAVARTPLDAIPDLSDVQVIIKTSYPGQAPQVVEDQVTYPLATAMLSVPGAVTVRGYSMFGDSFVYIIFKDGTDIYWARSRVLEYLSQVIPRLPRAAKPALGPDATGVGWIFEYALVDRSGKHDLSQLRALQDWFLKYELRTVPGVSEVAAVGGMVKQYQIVIDPAKLRAYRLTLPDVRMAVEKGNQESGGAVVELAEAEYMIRARGYVQGLKDLRAIPLGLTSAGAPIRLDQVAEIRLGPEMRRGITELNGEGEVAGGIIVMRYGENALATIEAVKQKLDSLRKSLPEGVEIVPTYDRAGVIQRAVRNLTGTLIEEFAIVALVCVAFLFHLRSSLVAIVMLPIGILVAFIVMHSQGINANIMSLGGIAIAIGAMVDAAIVMIENVHKHFEREGLADQKATDAPSLARGPRLDPIGDRWEIVRQATEEVGPPLFFSLLIITVSFLPVFALQAQEGRLFAPLAFTKTYAMAAAAGLSVTLVPVLMGYLIRGRIRPEHENPLNRALLRVYRPLLDWVLARPRQVLAGAFVLIALGAIPVMKVGTEFMPDMDEGDLLYMPTTLPGLSSGKAQQILQQTDRLLMTLPEVKTVFGKAGRAETATDPAPLSMFETTVQLKPKSEWRPGMTTEKLIAEMYETHEVPGAVQRHRAADQDAHRHAHHRHPHAGRHQGHGAVARDHRVGRARDRAGHSRRPRHHLGVRRAPDRRALCGHEDRPQPRRALRAQRHGHPGHGRDRGRRHERDRNHRGTRALPGEPALPGGPARLTRTTAEPADPDHERRAGPARRRRRRAHRRRPGHDPQRERAPLRLDLHRLPRPRHRLLRRRRAEGGGGQGEAAARLYDRLVGPV